MTQGIAADDRASIEDLMARYAWSLDTGDVESLVACFVPDGVLIEQVFDQPSVWCGHAALRELAAGYRQIPGFPARQHHGSALQLVAGPSTDTCRARSFVFVTEAGGDGAPPRLRFGGWFDDALARYAGDWRFTRRTLRRWPEGALAPSLGRMPPDPRDADAGR